MQDETEQEKEQARGTIEDLPSDVRADNAQHVKGGRARAGGDEDDDLNELEPQR